MNKVNNIMDGLGNVLLIIMFIVMMVVSSLAIISGYCSLQLANNMIKQTCIDISKHLRSDSVIKEGELTPAAKTYPDRLQSQSKGVLDSNTISFLFQVFSLALVSACVYLLSRSHSNLKTAEEKARAAARKTQLIGPFVANSSVSLAIESYLMIAYQNTWLLSKVTDEAAKVSSIAVARDSLTQLRNRLEQAARVQVGIERSQHDSFMDRARQILSNLKSIPPETQESVADLIDTCNECLDLLRNSDFVEKYEKQLATLLNNAED